MVGIGKAVIIALGVATSVVICYFDYRMGPNLSFLIFYFVPVLFVLWYAGAFPGIMVANASMTAWMAIDRFVRHPHSRLLLTDWNWLRAGMFIFLAYLLSLWKSRMDQQHEWAFADPLTGLGNRRSFTQCAQQEITRASRYHQPITVAFIDIDNFKIFNDQRGHGAGDNLLRVVGQNLQDNLRSMDVAARLGGDEFAILFPQIGSTDGRSAVEKIHSKLMECVHRHAWPVSVSMGAVSFLESPVSVEEMLNKADAQMYRVKKSGKAGWIFDVNISAA